MRRSRAIQLARWSAIAAVVVTAVVAGVYSYRMRQADRARREAPAVVPPTVQQQAAEFSFSKVEGDRTLFTVRASRTTEFTEGNRNRLEDVWITIYGREGKRFDNVHTRECDYDAVAGRLTCKGEVQIELESAEAARRSAERPYETTPVTNSMRLTTSNVTFENETGVARTDQAVEFEFPQGRGRAVGLLYDSRQAHVRLEREVAFTLTDTRAGAQPVTFSANALTLQRADRTLRLEGSVRVRHGNRELTAGSLTLVLDENLRARRAVASDRPQLTVAEKRQRSTLVADEMAVDLNTAGWMQRIEGAGNVSWESKNETGETQFAAERFELALVPQRNHPESATLTGNVRGSSSRGEETGNLQTAALRFLFSADGRGQRLTRAESGSRAEITLRTGEQRTRLVGERVAFEFGSDNRLERLIGSSGVSVERQLPGRPLQTSASQDLTVQFDPRGQWATIEQSGRIRFREAERTVQAERARIERSTDTIALTGTVEVADAVSRTTADSARLDQRSGAFAAEGHVRTTYRASDRGGVPGLSAQAAVIAADRLEAGRHAARAVYSGRARLWQGEALIEADSIELDRPQQQLVARQAVRAAFPEAVGAGKSAKAKLWRVTSNRLTYWSQEGRALLEENVTAQSGEGRIAARLLELFLAARGDARELQRAVATEGVTVRHGQRRATAERAEYVAAEGKFVLTGGQPTIYDALRGTTTGRQLTFFLAGDTILVDSEEGSRTLTKHRIEK